MITRAIFKPGQKGTRKLVQQYGDQLVCVRYHYDYLQRRRYKTVELIIQEDAWQPPPPHPEEEKARTQETIYSNKPVGVQIAWQEKAL